MVTLIECSHLVNLSRVNLSKIPRVDLTNLLSVMSLSIRRRVVSSRMVDEEAFRELEDLERE